MVDLLVMLMLACLPACQPGPPEFGCAGENYANFHVGSVGHYVEWIPSTGEVTVHETYPIAPRYLKGDNR